MRRGTNGRQIACQVQTIPETRLVNPREAFSQEFFALLGHVQINVRALRALHLADQRAGHDVARRQLLRLVIALHESFEANIPQHAALPAQRLGEQKPRGTLNRQRRRMKLHEFHIRQNRSGFVGDGHAVAGGNFGIRRLAINLSQPARGQQYRARAQLLQRAVGFIKEAKPGYAPAFYDQFRCERMRAEVQVWNGMGAGEQRAANLAPGRIAMRVQNSRPAVRRLARKRQLGSGAVKFRAPFDELRDVFRTFFHKQRNSLGAAQAIASIDRVLLVQPDFIFVGERHGDPALCPGGCGIAQI